MKKIYEIPECEIVKFNFADVVMASAETPIPVIHETEENFDDDLV